MGQASPQKRAKTLDVSTHCHREPIRHRSVVVHVSDGLESRVYGESLRTDADAVARW